ncbi:hydroxyethylthiazole kinase [Rhodobacteraceae bacterium SC52]|nr:hydroxyethylthiazole kinase [Rhodobacteraceae bacterium SC52]
MTLSTSPATALQTMRAGTPLVHCITNYVAMNIAANVLLAAGASPAMLHTPEESADFAAIAGALTINFGTLSPNWVDGMHKAVDGAQAAGKPWVFDPVAHYASPWRSGIARDLLARNPTILRANASEVLALGGGETASKGPDAGDEVVAAEATARALAKDLGGVVAVTGAVDFVTDGTRAVRIAGGSPLMPLVTAMGCSLTCLVGAYAAVLDDPFDATVGALALFAKAGDMAKDGAAGPASFQVAFVDALYNLQPAALETVALSDA